MRSLLTLIVGLLVGVSMPTGDGPPPTESRIRGIDGALVEFTTPMEMLQPRDTDAGQLKTLPERMAHYNVPGVSIAISDANEIEARAYGTIRAGSAIPVTTETLFEAASTSKLIVSAIALHYVEQGLLDLDADVNESLTSWRIPESPFTQEHPVTLRLLLTHQAGLNRPEGGFSWEDGNAPTLLQTLGGEAPAQNDPVVIEYEPGSQWQYSNFGYLVIQQLLEDVSGEPFAAIAKRAIFEPLGMTSSTFALPPETAPENRQALPHDAEGTAHEPQLNPWAVANGGLMTTPTDLSLFTNELMRAYRGESDRILTGAMAREMFRSEVDLDPAILGVPLGEGLGVLLFGSGDGFYFLHPGDNMPGATSWLMGCPSVASGVVVMTNGAMGNLLAMEIVAAVINEYDWPMAHDPAQ